MPLWQPPAEFQNKYVILVTGAAGKTGRAIVRALVGRGAIVRALVRREDQIGLIQSLGARETVVGDLRNPELLSTAVGSVRAIYHICPNVSPHELVIGRSLISAAQRAGIEHFVYHSVLHPQTQAMPHHWLKMRVEEAILESQLPYTILQPAAYMQNVLSAWTTVTEQGIYEVPYPAKTQLGMVDLEDVAEVAALVLSGAGHIGAVYELAGPDVLDQTELAQILSSSLERPVQVRQTTIAKWKRRARSSGLGEYQIVALTRMFAYYERHGFWGNPNVLTWLLGRRPTSFAGFVERHRRRLEVEHGGVS